MARVSPQRDIPISGYKIAIDQQASLPSTFVLHICGRLAQSPMDPLEVNLREVIEKMRDNDVVPLGIIAFDMQAERLVINLLHGVDPLETNALLFLVGIKVNFK